MTHLPNMITIIFFVQQVERFYEIKQARDTRTWRRGVEEKTYEVKFDKSKAGNYVSSAIVVAAGKVPFFGLIHGNVFMRFLLLFQV